MKKRKKGERDMFETKVHEAVIKHLPHESWAKTLNHVHAESDRLQRVADASPPPPGTVRKIESEVNEILVWPSGDLTIYGRGAWRLYNALLETHFHKDSSNDLGTGVNHWLKNMRHLLEHAMPCNDVQPQLEHALRVEAALMGADLDWPHFTCGPVAIRKATLEE